jgi:hypothetical protein
VPPQCGGGQGEYRLSERSEQEPPKAATLRRVRYQPSVTSVPLACAADMPAAPSSTIRRTRQCSRTSCAEPAVATLTYQYQRGAVWIDDLTPEREPYSYDLCERHADRISVPHGWGLEDRRTVLDTLDRLAG